MPSTAPVIVVPGVTATYLHDLYPLPPETIWAVIRKNFERVQLHPDDPRYEAHQPAMVRPGQIYEIAYEELIEELRYNLASTAEKPAMTNSSRHSGRSPMNTPPLSKDGA